MQTKEAGLGPRTPASRRLFRKTSEDHKSLRGGGGSDVGVGPAAVELRLRATAFPGGNLWSESSTLTFSP